MFHKDMWTQSLLSSILPVSAICAPLAHQPGPILGALWSGWINYRESLMHTQRFLSACCLKPA